MRENIKGRYGRTEPTLLSYGKTVMTEATTECIIEHAVFEVT